MIRLNDEWNQLFRAYEQDHQDPRNQACHKIGIPMIMASIPVGATVLGLPLAATMFTVGWGFQFAGHYFEGKPPSFVSDRRSLLVGALWWFEKQGVPLVDRERGEAAAALGGERPSVRGRAFGVERSGSSVRGRAFGVERLAPRAVETAR